MADRLEQQLGHYRLVRLIGSGIFADVYLAEHVYLNRQVAVKVLHCELAQEEFASFLHEAQTLARLKHPHIIPIFDFGIEQTTPFLVMEYLPHGSLRKRHPSGTVVPLPTILSYVNQIAGALQYAHEAKVIHRDVKPENMLLTSHGQVILSDFGLATAAHGTRSLLTMASLGGSPGYMAPEQWLGKPRPASDQYALGILVYEWLLGECPFAGSFQELYRQHLQVPPPSLRQKKPEISAGLEQIVLQALAKDAHQRFESVRAFAQALTATCQYGLTPAVSPPPQPPAFPLPTMIQETSPALEHDLPRVVQRGGSWE